MMDSLDQQVVIITGASSGIGAALARACSQRGASVALAARSQERLSNIARCCPGETLVVPCDVTVAKERRELVDAAVARWGRVDVLVNNAGIGYYAPFEEIDEASLRALLEVDFLAVFGMTQEVLRVMKPAGRGLIVQVASTGGLIAHAPRVSAYLAVKHAVVGMSRGLRRDLEGTGVRVQVVCPHLTDTGFFEAGIGAEAMKEVADRVRGHMDTADQVAEGILQQLGSERFIVFPTDRARSAYERFLEVA
jgi:short-subunit dehydrogenase